MALIPDHGLEPKCDGLYLSKTNVLSLFQRAFSPGERQVVTGNTVRHRRKGNNKMIVTAKEASGLIIAGYLSNIVINESISLVICTFHLKYNCSHAHPK